MKRTTRAAGFPRLLVSAVLAAAVAAGCAKPAPPPPAPPPKPERTVDWWLQQLTLEEKVGQLFWFGLKDNTVSPETEQLIREGKAGGFIFFARQGNDPINLRNMTDRMQSLTFTRERPTPGLVISVDHEGGIVQRWTAPFTEWPGNMAIGATRNADYAKQVATAMAAELKAVGMNLNLAPDADVNNNPANPVIGVRSFGEDPNTVSRFVAQAVAGMQAANVGATAKHFPGHGDTDVDTHKALSRVNHPMDRLSQVELVPFRSAIDAGVDVVMTAHLVFPAVEPDELPATLSPKVITGLLKEQMGFKGVVVTDAIDTMKAISDNYGTEKAIVMAVQAGADAVLVTESYGKQAILYSIMLEAAKDGRITQARLDDAVRRMLTLKAKRGLLPAEGATMPPTPAPEETVKAVSSQPHRDLARKVGAEALTLVRNKRLPLKPAADQQVLVVGPNFGGKVTGVPDIFTPLGNSIKQQHANTREITADRRLTADQAAAIRAAAATAGIVVYGVYNAGKYPEHQAMIKELVASGKPVVVVGMGEPYDLTVLPQIDTYLAAYGYMTPNLESVGGVLFGTVKPQGKLPVTIPDLYPLGHGLSY